MRTLIYLICGHYLGDYGLQNDYVVNFKRPGAADWLHVMSAHCAIHAGIVLLATGCVGAAIGEFVAHFVTDYLKCTGKIGYTVDQLIHLTCKVVWFLVSTY